MHNLLQGLIGSAIIGLPNFVLIHLAIARFGGGLTQLVPWLPIRLLVIPASFVVSIVFGWLELVAMIWAVEKLRRK